MGLVTSSASTNNHNLYFSKDELAKILNLYSKGVSSGCLLYTSDAADEMRGCLVGSEMCIRDRVSLDNAKGLNGTVIVFICNHCPYVKAIASRLKKDADLSLIHI